MLRLHEIAAICLEGPYTLKSGLISPFYINLRLIVSYPEVLQAVSEHLYNLVSDRHFDVVCGVPYTALPMATLLSVAHGVPMVMRRKEGSKAYGLKKSIEGVWKSDGTSTCLVVEDLVTSGLSVFETIEPLQAAGMKVEDVVVLINREQGGKENIEARGVRLHALLTVTQVMDILHARGKIAMNTVEQVKQFVQNSRAVITQPIPALAMVPKSPEPDVPTRLLSYGARVSHAKNAAARALFGIMESKQTNLCVSADVTTSAELLRLAEQVGPLICALKTHVDILADFTSNPDLVNRLRQLSKQHNFLLFEDRKFADIGSTVAHQVSNDASAGVPVLLREMCGTCSSPLSLPFLRDAMYVSSFRFKYAGGVFRVAEWAHITNCHVIPGPGVIQGLEQAAKAASAEAATTSAASASASSSASTTGAAAAGFDDSARGLLLIAEMSSSGALATGSYTDANVTLAEDPAHETFVMGFICQRQLSNKPGLVHMTPGVQLPKAQEASASTSASAVSAPAPGAPGAPVRTGVDSLGQQYTSPSSVIGAAGSDVIIVGRAILTAKDPVAEAQRYREAGWKAYTDSLRQEQ